MMNKSKILSAKKLENCKNDLKVFRPQRSRLNAKIEKRERKLRDHKQALEILDCTHSWGETESHSGRTLSYNCRYCKYKIMDDDSHNQKLPVKGFKEIK